MSYNFYPGPSKVYPQIATYFQEAMDLGILEKNHRSDSFHELFATTKTLLKSKLNIPLDYEIVMVSSATECWEIIAQSFVKKASIHYYNGAFGEKWFNYTSKIHSSSEGQEFNISEFVEIKNPTDSPELIALTHNETSNGYAIPENYQKYIRDLFPDSLIAYDATSSMAGYDLNWDLGDIWYASVQKCFGLPSGMAIMIVSPKAIGVAKEIGDNKFYNSFNFVLKNARKNETHYTPNISNIFLLNRLMQNVENIRAIYNNLIERKELFFNQLTEIDYLAPIITNPEFQSDTVFCLSSNERKLKTIKQVADKKGFILGNGYGELKDTTLRIANFPAIPNQDFIELINFFQQL
ncbi:alanine--glyoxylate aminotransferase family protein [Marivirga arenosa]|uniref:Alanine--glyoxylate aminotransferase family protein n=1 Tax=Marivirga arenosa TaxID=3059076 RepID=A0AA51ZV50_9BACT|nr:alanine--glyoxylate aminotransferase family protein [Marivirga sp. BKB1-2]WNB17309.1 alanine--glyoxylate aminotransferase family protein [Marivirga sp. BKB1-2]